MTDERQNKRNSAITSNCGTSAGAAAAGAGAAAPAIMTGASEMFSFDFSKLFRSATWSKDQIPFKGELLFTSSKFKLEMSSTIRVIFSE